MLKQVLEGRTHRTGVPAEDIMVISTNSSLWVKPFLFLSFCLPSFFFFLWREGGVSLLSLLRAEITDVSHHTQPGHSHFLKLLSPLCTLIIFSSTPLS